ncbi:MAG TPA: MFS transporter [Kiritimatiellia bacterium]|nr:MFS transporter [Kiritimatiellia bacterium]HRR32923.1 MFS transporter [Kiritimatiellia bacterium]
MSEPDTSGSGGFRWTICAMLFFATTINYVDRAVLGILKPSLERELGWTQIEYGWIVTAFQLTYALGYVSAGRLIDHIGVRLGFLGSVSTWSLAAMAHAAVRTVFGFTVARAGLGLAQGGMFPAAIKAVAEWFPKEERAFATGVFNAGSNVGAVVCPLIVPWLATQWGWQAAFIVTGALGFPWVAAWLWLYRSPETHPRVSAAELAHIRKDPPDPAGKIPWRILLRYRQTWAFVVGMAASSPIWWFYIFWVPDFLNKRYGLGLTQSSLPLMIMFLAASFGGIGGGWLSSRLLKLGWTVNAARKTALLVCALCVMPVMATPCVPEPWLAMVLVGLAAAAHCGFAANLFTLVSDTVPKQGVSSVVGIGGMAGALGGMVFAQLVARVLDYTGNHYFVPFAIASLSYLVALAVMHVLVPRLERMEVQA